MLRKAAIKMPPKKKKDILINPKENKPAEKWKYIPRPHLTPPHTTTEDSQEGDADVLATPESVDEVPRLLFTQPKGQEVRVQAEETEDEMLRRIFGPQEGQGVEADIEGILFVENYISRFYLMLV